MSAAGPRAGHERRVGELLAEMMSSRAAPMEALVSVTRAWASVVGPALARASAPFDLVGGTLCVATSSPHAAQQIERMAGNVSRALRDRWGLEIAGVRATVGPPPPRPARPDTSPRRKAPVVQLTDDEVRAMMERCPTDLDPEAAEALARLRAFFERRFPASRGDGGKIREDRR